MWSDGLWYYQVTTNFGTYFTRLQPSTEDAIKYYCAAKKAGIAIKSLKFEIKVIQPKLHMLSDILKDVRPNV